jgi:cytochrome b561
MQWRNTQHGYGAAMRMFHWFSALLVGVAWTLGTLGDELPKGRPRELGELIHVSAGEVIALFLILRIGWRFIDPPPPADETPLGRRGEIIAKIVHVALYALLAAVIVAGVVTQFADGDALSALGVFDVPSPWPKDKAFAHDMKEIHEALANALVILATIHAASALVHHLAFGDRTLRRMLPDSSGSR